jgi:hypothetical protein
MHDTTEPSYTVARPGAGQANLNAVEDPRPSRSFEDNKRVQIFPIAGLLHLIGRL